MDIGKLKHATNIAVALEEAHNIHNELLQKIEQAKHGTFSPIIPGISLIRENVSSVVSSTQMQALIGPENYQALSAIVYPFVLAAAKSYIEQLEAQFKNI